MSYASFLLINWDTFGSYLSMENIYFILWEIEHSILFCDTGKMTYIMVLYKYNKCPYCVL